MTDVVKKTSRRLWLVALGLAMASGCGSDPDSLSEPVRSMMLALEEMESGEGEIVRARIQGGGIALATQVTERDLLGRETTVTGQGVGTWPARLEEDGSLIYVWIPSDVTVPEAALIEVRAGQHGYYFEAVAAD